MICWVLLTPAGCVARAGIGRQPPAGHVPLPPGVGPAAADRIMYVDGAWQARPDLPPVQVTPTGRLIQDCPDGVQARIYDAETLACIGEVAAEAGALAIDLPPGSYRIEFVAPEPWTPPPPVIATLPTPEQP